jgi:hypothetical protein
MSLLPEIIEPSGRYLQPFCPAIVPSGCPSFEKVGRKNRALPEAVKKLEKNDLL